MTGSKVARPEFGLCRWCGWEIVLLDGSWLRADPPEGKLPKVCTSAPDGAHHVR